MGSFANHYKLSSDHELRPPPPELIAASNPKAKELNATNIVDDVIVEDFEHESDG